MMSSLSYETLMSDMSDETHSMMHDLARVADNDREDPGVSVIAEMLLFTFDDDLISHLGPALLTDHHDWESLQVDEGIGVYIVTCLGIVDRIIISSRDVKQYWDGVLRHASRGDDGYLPGLVREHGATSFDIELVRVVPDHKEKKSAIDELVQAGTGATPRMLSARRHHRRTLYLATSADGEVRVAMQTNTEPHIHWAKTRETHAAGQLARWRPLLHAALSLHDEWEIDVVDRGLDPVDVPGSLERLAEEKRAFIGNNNVFDDGAKRCARCKLTGHVSPICPWDVDTVTYRPELDVSWVMDDIPGAVRWLIDRMPRDSRLDRIMCLACRLDTGESNVRRWIRGSSPSHDSLSRIRDVILTLDEA